MSIVHLCIARIFVISLVISNSKAYILKLSSFAPLSPYSWNYSQTIVLPHPTAEDFLVQQTLKSAGFPFSKVFSCSQLFQVVPLAVGTNCCLLRGGKVARAKEKQLPRSGIEEKRHYYNTLTQSDKWNRMLYCRVKTGENNKIIILRRNPAQIGTGNADASYCKRCERARVLGMDQRLRKGGEDKTLREDYERVNAISFLDFVFLSDQKSNSERWLFPL